MSTQRISGRLWAECLLIIAAIMLGGQLAQLDADVSRRGDVFSSPSNVTASYIPDVDNAYDLGSASHEFKDLYVDGISYLDEVSIGGQANFGTGTKDKMSSGSGNVYASGDVEVDDDLFVEDVAYFYGAVTVANTGSVMMYTTYGSSYSIKGATTEITIPVSQGSAGVLSTVNMIPADAELISLGVRVTQAPGGGATTLDVGRYLGGNTDEFIDGISTALGTTGTLVSNNDGVLTHDDLWNPTAVKIQVTTDSDVTVSPMKVRVSLVYGVTVPPTS